MKTKFKLGKYTETKVERSHSGLLSTVETTLKEGLINDKTYGNFFKEKLNFKEDVNTTTADGAYTTALSSLIYNTILDDKRLQEAMSLVSVNSDMVGSSGFGAMKLPKQEVTTAVVVAEGSIINYSDEGVDSVTVEPQKYISGTKITWEIKKRGFKDFMTWMMNNAADAVIRKRISNIVNGLAAGAGNATTGGLTYAKFLEARGNVTTAAASNGAKYNFMPDKFVVSSDYFGTIMQDEDFKKAMYTANANPGINPNEMGIHFARYVAGCEIIETPFLTGAQALVLDSKKAAVWVKESELEFLEGRIPQSVDTEILVMESGVLAVMFTDAICSMGA